MAILASTTITLGHREETLFEIIGMIDDAVMDEAGISSQELADTILDTVEKRMKESRHHAYHDGPDNLFAHFADEITDSQRDLHDSSELDQLVHDMLGSTEERFRKVWAGA